MRIILADDHAIMRCGLRAILEKRPGTEVVAEASSGREAVAKALDLQPDIVVMDIGMPELNGIEATRQLKKKAPLVKVIALSMHNDHGWRDAMLDAGACGYVVKDCVSEELWSAIATTTAGGIYVSQALGTGPITARFSPELRRQKTLTGREREVLQLIAEGETSKGIASRLGISLATVEFHRGQIMRKLSLRTIADLTKFALREGLTSLER